MGYADTGKYAKSYYPSDTALVVNLAADTTVSTTYVKLKEIKIASTVVQGSTFRFKFDLRNFNGVRTAYGKIYINGVAEGTERSRNANTVAIYSEDLTHTNWKIGDTIELWSKLNAGGKDTAEVSNFQICGFGSEFENTLGA